MPEICLFDGIGRDPESGTGTTAKEFDQQLKALGNPGAFVLRINSPGGDVMDGMAIYSMIRASRATVTARVEGIAASAASLIAMACDRIEIAENAFMLIHMPYTTATGSAGDLATAADDLEKLSDQYARIYSGRSGQSLGAVKALMREDRLMSAEEAVEFGYADAIAGNGVAPNMSSLPRKHRAVIRAAKRDTSHGWDRAIANAFGKHQRAPLSRGWEAAIAKVAAERGATRAADHGWGAAIAKLKR